MSLVFAMLVDIVPTVLKTTSAAEVGLQIATKSRYISRPQGQYRYRQMSSKLRVYADVAFPQDIFFGLAHLGFCKVTDKEWDSRRFFGCSGPFTLRYHTFEQCGEVRVRRCGQLIENTGRRTNARLDMWDQSDRKFLTISEISVCDDSSPHSPWRVQDSSPLADRSTTFPCSRGSDSDADKSTQQGTASELSDGEQSHLPDVWGPLLPCERWADVDTDIED